MTLLGIYEGLWDLKSSFLHVNTHVTAIMKGWNNCFILKEVW